VTERFVNSSSVPSENTPELNNVTGDGSAFRSEIDAEVAAWYVAATLRNPCPICLESPELGGEFSYVEISTHSWSNSDRCDAHGICRFCLQRYVEIKIIDECIWNIRCPGEGCRYQLLAHDVAEILKGSERESRANELYEQNRTENCGLRLQMVLQSALANVEEESWVWKECQACPQCLILARREDGCNHLACRCGCHFCFVCGGSYDSSPGCCCSEFQLYKFEHAGIRRAFLAMSLSFKHDAHPALGTCRAAVRSEIEKQLQDRPCVTIPLWERMVLGKVDIDLKCKWREAKKRGALLQKEKAAEEWAYRQVCGTRKALEIRGACECFGAALWQAGLDVCKPDVYFENETFEGLLVNSTMSACANETDEDWIDELLGYDNGSVDMEFQFDEEDCEGAKALRYAAHGAPRRLWTGKAWVAGSKIKVTAPVHPRQQKQANVKDARQRVAEGRHVRKLRRSKRKFSP